MNYYKRSIEEVKKLLKKDENLAEEKWNEYKKGKALCSSKTIMWIYSETDNWNDFIKKIRREL